MKEPMDKESVLNSLEKGNSNVKFVDIVFPDILGFLRGFSIPKSEVEEALKDGKGFDGSSINGLVRIEESDLIAKPDPTTFRVLPWEYENEGERFQVGLMFCDILNPNGTHNNGDTRYVLKKTLERAEKMGFKSFKVGPELEFFYFPNNRTPIPLDNGGYFSMGSDDPYAYLRQKTILNLKNMDITPEFDHHEVAKSQHEIDLKYDNALEMADITMIFKHVVKETARREGLYATFMPKPLDGENGSGMHVHQSLWNDGKNLLFDEEGEYYLSEIGKKYTSGILTHINEITSVLNQWVNSYKRLIPGFEAPVYHTWGQRNRSALIRVPEYKPGKENATRIELRSPDPGCNPYLAFSLMLASGLDGIKNDYELPPPTEENIYKNGKGMKTLPVNLEDALRLTEESSLVKETLGDHLFEKFLENKRIQISDYRRSVGEEWNKKVSPFEIKTLLPIL
ncbi:MAG: glutamine synthetase [Candidatus Aenigmarchaeota archaeon]|nr:glutamine synthetase [Candidatus Aenigmarchaeota archaeon]